jgi:hypothetical protein
MCVATMIATGIGALYYGASVGAVGAHPCRTRGAPPRPFTIEGMRAQVGLPVEQRQMPAAQKLDDAAVAVLEAWAAKRQGS